jgi:hypothetical protein
MRSPSVSQHTSVVLKPLVMKPLRELHVLDLEGVSKRLVPDMGKQKGAHCKLSTHAVMLSATERAAFLLFFVNRRALSSRGFSANNHPPRFQEEGDATWCCEMYGQDVAVP